MTGVRLEALQLEVQQLEAVVEQQAGVWEVQLAEVEPEGLAEGEPEPGREQGRMDMGWEQLELKPARVKDGHLFAAQLLKSMINHIPQVLRDHREHFYEVQAHQQPGLLLLKHGK